MVNFAVLTVSDRSATGQRTDVSGPALVEAINHHGWNIVETSVIADEIDAIKSKLLEWCSCEEIHIILTTGGTGFAPRDVTPEATLQVIERLAPGMAEAMRHASLQITRHAMLSRACAGIRGQTLIINLPGSPKAAVETFEVVRPVLKHAVDLMRQRPESESGHAIR